MPAQPRENGHSVNGAGFNGHGHVEDGPSLNGISGIITERRMPGTKIKAPGGKSMDLQEIVNNPKVIYDYLIIGGGGVGMQAVQALRDRNIATRESPVLLLEAEPEIGGTLTRISAQQGRTLQEVEDVSNEVTIGTARMRAIGEEHHNPNAVTPITYAYIAGTQERLSEDRKHIDTLRNEWHVAEAYNAQVLDGPELRREIPMIKGSVAGGLLYPAHLYDWPGLFNAMRVDAEKSGAATIETNTRVKELAMDGDRVIGVVLDNGDVIRANNVILATGGLFNKFFAQVGREDLNEAIVLERRHSATALLPAGVQTNIEPVFLINDRRNGGEYARVEKANPTTGRRTAFIGHADPNQRITDPKSIYQQTDWTFPTWTLAGLADSISDDFSPDLHDIPTSGLQAGLYVSVPDQRGIIGQVAPGLLAFLAFMGEGGMVGYASGLKLADEIQGHPDPKVSPNRDLTSARRGGTVSAL